MEELFFAELFCSTYIRDFQAEFSHLKSCHGFLILLWLVHSNNFNLSQSVSYNELMVGVWDFLIAIRNRQSSISQSASDYHRITTMFISERILFYFFWNLVVVLHPMSWKVTNLSWWRNLLRWMLFDKGVTCLLLIRCGFGLTPSPFPVF